MRLFPKIFVRSIRRAHSPRHSGFSGLLDQDQLLGVRLTNSRKSFPDFFEKRRPPAPFQRHPDEYGNFVAHFLIVDVLCYLETG